MCPEFQRKAGGASRAGGLLARCVLAAAFVLQAAAAARAVEIEIGVASRGVVDGLEFVHFSADERTMATTHWGNVVHLWDMKTLRVRSSVSVANRDFDFDLAPDGRALAVWNEEGKGEIELYDTDDGRPLRALPAPRLPPGESRRGRSLVYRDDGTLEFVSHGWIGGHARKAYLLAVPAGQPRVAETPLPALVNSVAFRKSAVMDQGRLLLAGVDGADDELAIMDIASGRMLAREPGFRIASYAADARRAVFVEADGKQRILAFDFSSRNLSALPRWTGSGKFQPYRFVAGTRFLVLSPDEPEASRHRAAPGIYDLQTRRLHRLPPDADPGSVDVRGATASYVLCNPDHTACQAEVADLAISRKLGSFAVQPAGDFRTWISPSGSMVVVGGADDGTMTVWGVKEQRVIGPN
ncbi:hypothetical protein CUR95_08310 [Bordetella bronchiseptica]|nr:hypothetical protein [Bordetella bronchiseptica]